MIDLKFELFHGITLICIKLVMVPHNSKVSLQLKNERDGKISLRLKNERVLGTS